MNWLKGLTVQRAIALLLLVILALLPVLSEDRFFQHVGSLVILNIIGAVGINLVLKTGYSPICYAPLVGTGGYTAALLVMKAKFPWPLAILGAMVVCGLVGYVLARLLVRVKGVYFVLATYAFGEAIVMLFANWVKLFGGVQGLAGIPAVSVLGHRFVGTEYYYVLLGVAAAVLAVVYWVERSGFGEVLQSLYEHELLTEAIGYNTRSYKVVAFVAMSVLAGLTGALFAPFTNFLAPEMFSFNRSVDFVIYSVVGGVWRFEGPILGATVYTVLPELLRSAAGLYKFLYGLSVVLLLVVLPGGICPSPLDRGREGPVVRAILRLLRSGKSRAGSSDQRDVA